MRNTSFLAWAAAACFFLACEPQQDDKIEIGAPPETVSFSIEAAGTPNTYFLKNTTQGAFLYSWEYETGTATGETAEAWFPEKGDYEITLTVFARGGSASASQTLTVPEDAPFNCATDPAYEFLTNCDQKTWRLNPAAGALWVGPADGSQTWWANALADVAGRPCAFNDEWTFTAEGEMIYDTKGDLWAEDYMGFNFECVAESQLAPNQAAWGSGSHGFSILPGSPPKLALDGLGAYIGLPKAANGAEVSEPQQSVTYDITGMDAGLLELEVNFGGGIWRFTLIAI